MPHGFEVSSPPAWEVWLADLAPVFVGIWLVGAAAYITLRLNAYFALRLDLLSEARPVGNEGKVRLVETPATRSPLAFGIFDKVVALPPGFMAHPDRAARDLALAHELSHHRSHDLAANFAALPLFAIHWFNPLSWLGWNAMRRDQEAACDARVVEGRDRTERAHYAEIIAGAAAAPRAALAAPMACPVLGEKSIIHRLRNLTMTDHSTRRRRLGGAMIAAGALALPLTASIVYAQPEAPVAPEAPQPPEAPASALLPAPPVPPAPPADLDEVTVIETPDGKERVERRRVVIVHKKDGEGAPKGAEWQPREHVRKIILQGPDGKLLSPDDPKFKERMKDLEAKLAKLDTDLAHKMVFDEKRMMMFAERSREMAEHSAKMGTMMPRMAPRIEMSCEGQGEINETKSEDGRQVVRICRSKMMGGAAVRLKAARAAIAGNDDMNAETRREVLEKLDGEIARLESQPKE